MTSDNAITQANDLLKQLLDDAFKRGFEAGEISGRDKFTNDLLDFLSSKDQVANIPVHNFTPTTKITVEVENLEKEQPKPLPPVSSLSLDAAPNRPVYKSNLDPEPKKVKETDGTRSGGIPEKILSIMREGHHKRDGIAANDLFDQLLRSPELVQNRKNPITKAVLNTAVFNLKTKGLIYKSSTNNRWYLCDVD